MNRFELIDNVERAMAHDHAAIETLYKYTYLSMYSMVYNMGLQ